MVSPVCLAYLSNLSVFSCRWSSFTDRNARSSAKSSSSNWEKRVHWIPLGLSDAFLRDLYNESFAPVTWDSLFVPNRVEQVSQDSCSCTEVGRQHFSMNGVYAWGFSTLQSFDGISNFRFCWGTGVDVEVIWHWWGVGGFIWLRVVQDFTEIFNPSISLFTCSCNSAAIFAFHRGRVSSVITRETFGDLVDSAQFTSCCSTLSFCC